MNNIHPAAVIMSQQIDDGGPAFPQHGWSSDPHASWIRCEGKQGMSLRDHFAAAAMHAFVSNNSAMNQLLDAVENGVKNGGDRRHVTNAVIAKRSYWLADAMLAERTRTKEGQEETAQEG